MKGGGAERSKTRISLLFVFGKCTKMVACTETSGWILNLNRFWTEFWYILSACFSSSAETGNKGFKPEVTAHNELPHYAALMENHNSRDGGIPTSFCFSGSHLMGGFTGRFCFSDIDPRFFIK